MKSCLTSSVLHQVMQLLGMAQELQSLLVFPPDAAAHSLWCSGFHTPCRHFEKNFSDPTFTYTLTRIRLLLSTHFTSCQSLVSAQMLTLRSVPREAGELCPLDPGRWWCWRFPNCLSSTNTSNPAWSQPEQKRAAPSQPPSAWGRTRLDKAASSLWDISDKPFFKCSFFIWPYNHSFTRTRNHFDHKDLSGCIVAAFVDCINLSEKQTKKKSSLFPYIMSLILFVASDGKFVSWMLIQHFCCYDVLNPEPKIWDLIQLWIHFVSFNLKKHLRNICLHPQETFFSPFFIVGSK